MLALATEKKSRLRERSRIAAETLEAIYQRKHKLNLISAKVGRAEEKRWVQRGFL